MFAGSRRSCAGSSAELAKLRSELRGAVHDALTDPLTGLANRRSFDLELRAVAARAGRSLPAHLVMVDIDNFKHVNDTRGHDIGDEVLRIVGEVLLANVRRDSLVARVGGDEFGVLLPWASPHYTAAIATRLCELLASRRLSCVAAPKSSSGSRFRSGWPVGTRAKAVPNGSHAPMWRCTRRSAEAAIGSASLVYSSFSFNFAGGCKFQIWPHILFLPEEIGLMSRNVRRAWPKWANKDICAELRDSGEKAHAKIWRDSR